jgi:HD-like signal output (HDOD) protein
MNQERQPIKQPEGRQRILFVDDEPAVLQGIEGPLRTERRRWEVLFATSGEEALQRLHEQPVDVIVSDMRMPGMDGATLLRRVREEHPEVVRFILSGYNDIGATMRSVQVAHQCLAKPCDPATLRGAIDWACKLRRMLKGEAIRRAIGEVERLPSLPHLYLALTHAIENPRASTRDIAEIIRQDVAMSAKILQLVNSSFFGLARRITSIESAVAYLGTNTIRSLLLTVEVFGAMGSKLPGGLQLERVQRHSMLSAQLTRLLLRGDPRVEEGFTAAMLHEIGVLLLATRMPEQFAELPQLAIAQRRSLQAIERESLGVTHAEVGAYLLGLWGLPYSIVEALAQHHQPQPGSEGRIVEAVALADRLADEVLPLLPGVHLYDEGHEEDPRLDSLRALAAEEARKLPHVF